MITSLGHKMFVVLDHKNSTILREKKHGKNNAIGRNQVGELDVDIQFDSALKIYLANM